MKTASRILFALAIGFFTFTGLSAQGNLSREETKYWKDKAKEYRRNLPALKNLVENAEQYQNQVNDLQQQVSDLQAQILMKDRQIVSFEEQTESMNQRVIDAESKARQASSQPAPPPPTSSGTTPSITGTIFRVQIGAFQRNRIDYDLATGNNITLTEDSDGFQKVRVGEFRQYENARRLRNKIREIGISDAFIVAFQDGQPIDVETAVQYTGETFID